MIKITGDARRHVNKKNKTKEIDIDAKLEQELKIFDFSFYPLPEKESGVLRIFYNNVNGLEINNAINARITNSWEKKNTQYSNQMKHIQK